MSISIPSVSNVFQTQTSKAASLSTPAKAQSNFASMLKDSLNKVNEAQNQSDIMTEKLAKGENVDLHQVMIASQKASVTMSATLEIRNKVIEAYQEVMRMQV